MGVVVVCVYYWVWIVYVLWDEVVGWFVVFCVGLWFDGDVGEGSFWGLYWYFEDLCWYWYVGRDVLVCDVFEVDVDCF